MRSSVEERVLRSHQHKLLEAVDALSQARQRLLAAAVDRRESAAALGHQAAQGWRRSHEVLSDADHLIARAERLVAEARAIHGESTDVELSLAGEDA